jgi:hypothetical protein
VSSDQEQVGSLGEEAAKLFTALQGWAEQSGSEYAEAAGAAASGAASVLHDLDEHLATGGADCTYCPVCRVISAVRGTSPEVRAHLRLAATSLVEAAAGMLATPTGSTGSTGSGGTAGADRAGPRVERIDITGDDDTDDTDGTDGTDDNQWKDG